MDPRLFLISLVFGAVACNLRICRHASKGEHSFPGFHMKVIDEYRMGPALISIPNDCPPNTMHIGSNVTVCSDDLDVTVQVPTISSAFIETVSYATNSIKAVILCTYLMESEST